MPRYGVEARAPEDGEALRFESWKLNDLQVEARHLRRTRPGRANGSQALQGVPRRIWRLLCLARHRVLMLDYDGTLAPFQVIRGAALPLPNSLEMLRVIAADRQTSLAIISGRPVAELVELLGPLRATIVGEHGWEMRTPDGAVVPWTPPLAALSALDQARQAATRRGWGERLERKRSGLVLHTRDLPAEDARHIEDACTSLWRRYCDQAPVNLDRISGGIELRTRGRDKGTAVLTILAHEPPGSLAVYVGDDVSDEDAFQNVLDVGFGIRVGAEQRPSLAAGQLPSCHAVAEFLEAWHGIVGAPAGDGTPGWKRTACENE